MRRSAVLRQRAALMAVLMGLVAGASAAPKAQHPDLSGFWNLTRARPIEDPALAAKLAPGTVVLQDTGPVEYGIMNFGGLKLKPDALERAKHWNAKDDLSVENACRVPSIVYALQGPFPIEIFQGTEFTVMKLEYFDMVRVIFTDGRPHLPADGPHSKTGDSIAHWEGDTLVVDTTHLKEATITNNGLSHSDNIHVIERFRLSADKQKLLATQEFEDPEVLDNRGARFITWERVKGDHVHAYDCDPSFAESYSK
jgi:hypothetical protein